MRHEHDRAKIRLRDKSGRDILGKHVFKFSFFNFHLRTRWLQGYFSQIDVLHTSLQVNTCHWNGIHPPHCPPISIYFDAYLMCFSFASAPCNCFYPLPPNIAEYCNREQSTNSEQHFKIKHSIASKLIRSTVGSF